MLLIRICLFLSAISLFFMKGGHEGLTMMYPNTTGLPVSSVEKTIVSFNDTIPNDTLYTLMSEEGYPVSYFRKIETGVCIDGKCRIMNIILHWAITGRYLGFELPKGEFLSKTEHVRFSHEEYQRLHKLLSNPYSLLANFTINELIPQKSTNAGKVDAISAATIAGVSDYIVKGAVYTSYTLWHIVYGNTRSVVIRKTEQALTPELVQLILKSPNMEDKAWGLGHINGFVEFTPELQSSVLNFIQNENYYLAERAINAITPENLGSDSLQLRLSDKFDTVNFGLKLLILDKLKEAPMLNAQVAERLAARLNGYRGSVTNNILKLFTKYQISTPEICRLIAELLQHKNSFISRKAYQYLSGITIQDKKINRLLHRYKSKHQL